MHRHTGCDIRYRQRAVGLGDVFQDAKTAVQSLRRGTTVG